MNIAAARQAIADALSGLAGLNTIKTRTVRLPKANDGWVLVGRVEPGESFATYSATFTAVLLLGADEAAAETRMEDLMVPVMSAITKHPTLRPGDVALEPSTVLVGDTTPAPFFALVLTLTLEVD